MFISRLMSVSLSLLAAVALSACGGGGADGGDPLPPPPGGEVVETIELTSVPEADGVAIPGFASADREPVAGDNRDRIPARAIYTFDLSQLPAGATVTSATLRIRQIDNVGNPYEDLANVVLDHVNLGGQMPDNAFDAPATPGNLAFATFSSDEDPVIRPAIVTPQVLLDRESGRQYSQFRLRHQVNFNLDGADDITVWADGEDTAGFGDLPTLVVRYTR